MTRKAITAIAVAMLTMAGGCTSQPEAVSGRKPPSITMPLPISVRDPAPPTTVGTEPCNPNESYRPRGLPEPAAVPAGSTMAKIRDRGRLILGVGTGAYQLSFPNPTNGKMEGFEAEIAREIALAIFGVRDDSKIQFRTTNASERIPAITSGQVDMVIAAMTMNCERWDQIAFSASYYTSGHRLLVNRDSPIKSVDDLGGKKVCASSTGTNIPVIQSLPAKPVAVGALNTADCLLMLQQRQIDAVSTGDVILAGLAAQDRGSVIVGERFTLEPTGIGMSRQSIDLVRFVNAILEKLTSNGTWTGLQKQWLAEQIGESAPPVPEYKAE